MSADAEEQLERLNAILIELLGKVPIKRRAEILKDACICYQACSNLIYSEANEIIDINFLLDKAFANAMQEAIENDKKREQKTQTMKTEAVSFFIQILKDISIKLEILEEHIDVLPNILKLLNYETIRGEEKQMTELGIILFNIISTIGLSYLEDCDLLALWSFCWKVIQTPYNLDYVYLKFLRILRNIFENFMKTILSVDFERNVTLSIEEFFENIKVWKCNGQTSMRLQNEILELSNVLLDNFGILLREPLLNKLFPLAESVLHKVELELDENMGTVPRWLFLEKLTMLAFMNGSCFVDDRVYELASKACKLLISDLENKSLTRFPGYLIPPPLVPLFAKMIVIAESANSIFTIPSTSKKIKSETPLETILGDFLLHRRTNISLKTILILLDEVVRTFNNLNHTSNIQKLSFIASYVFNLPKSSIQANYKEYCKLATSLIISGVLDNFTAVKMEKTMSNLTKDPHIIIKGLWKNSIAAANTEQSSEAAIELFLILMKKFKSIIAPEKDDDLVETISTIISLQASEKMLELLSQMLTTLEFDELKTFSGAENREVGLPSWIFRCQVAETIIQRVNQDISVQLFQICCYHPQQLSRKKHKELKDGLKRQMELVSFCQRNEGIEIKPDENVESCLIIEVIEYIAHLLVDKFVQCENIDKKFTLFTSILCFASYIEGVDRVTRNQKAINSLENLLFTVNHWLAEILQSSNDLSSLYPGHGSRFISLLNRQLIQTKSENCPTIYSTFPTEMEVPPSKMKQYLTYSISLLHKYGDYPISIVLPKVKEEFGRHRLSYKKSIMYSKFLATRALKFIEEKVDFFPDILVLLNIIKEILSEDQMAKIISKAEMIIIEDKEDDSELKTTLKRRMLQDIVQDPLLVLLRHVQDNVINSELNQNTLELLMNSSKTSLLVKQALIRKYLTVPGKVDGRKLLRVVKDNSQLYQTLRETFLELPLYEEALIIEAKMLEKWNMKEFPSALDLLKQLAVRYSSLKQNERIGRIIREIFTQMDDQFYVLSIVSAGIASNDKSLNDLMITDSIHEMKQLMIESFGLTKKEKEIETICEGVVQQLLNTGELQKIGFCHTKLFWKLMKKCLTTSRVNELDNKGIYLYDLIIFLWDLLPQRRMAIGDVLCFFKQSRENGTRRGLYNSENLKKIIQNYCHLKIMNPQCSEKGVTGACLELVKHLEGKSKVGENIKSIQSNDASFTLCQKLLHYLKENEEKVDVLEIVNAFFCLPGLSDLVTPFLFSFSRKAGYILLEYVESLDYEAHLPPRLARVLAESIDGCGLNNLAMLEVEGASFVHIGRLLLYAGYTKHAYAVANLAFDRIIGVERNFAAYDDSFPEDEDFWQLVGSIYVSTNNWEALDSLPRLFQNDAKIQLTRSVAACQWLEVASSPVADYKLMITAKWFCGIDANPMNNDLKYMDGVIAGKWEIGYPKRLNTHYKRLYAYIKNQNQYSEFFAEKLKAMYLSEIADCTTIPTDHCKNLYDFEVLSTNQPTESFLEELPLDQLCLLMWRMLRYCYYLGGPTATMTYMDYKKHYVLSTVLLLDKLNEKKAYMAALSILPLINSVLRDSKLDLLRLALKEVELHMEMGHYQLVENILHNLSTEIRIEGEQETLNEEINVGIEVVCLLSKLKAEHTSKNVEQALVPLKALNKCNMTNERAVQHVFSLALRQLQEIEAHMESPIIKLRKEAIENHRKSFNQLRYSGVVSTEEQRRAKIVAREYECERQELIKLDEKLKLAVIYAVQSAIDLLGFVCNGVDESKPISDHINKQVLKALFPLIDLVFRYENNHDVLAIFKGNILCFPIAIWLFVLPHILPHCFRESPLTETITKVVVQLIVAYPYHTINTVLSYKYKDQHQLSEKAEIVNRLLDQAVKEECKLQPILNDIQNVHRIYRQFVWLPLKRDKIGKDFELVTIKKKDKEVQRYKMSPSSCLIANLSLLRKAPLPTVTQPVGLPRDYSLSNLILWAQIDPHCEKADGNSSPKIVRVRGSNGALYKMVWKDGESVRQDSLVQDLFIVMSDLLNTDQPLRTYNVIPLDSMSGIIEFCEGTASMKDILIGPDSHSTGGLHLKIYPFENVCELRKKMSKKQMNDKKELTIEEFKSCLRRVTPVFRHHFYRNFPRVYDWHENIQIYTKSLAQWSIVCYVVGLGDRHASNVLFETKTSNFVHIDLGMILEFSRRMLPIPELVPFRLTRDILDPILIQGIKGNLTYEATNSLEKMRRNKDVILGVASVFLRETISNFKDTTDDKQKSFASATAFGRLQAKLTGTDATISPISSADQANRLLAEATNLENLAKLFSGWLAIV